MDIPIFCFDCGATGSVGRVTAGLQCTCGSDNLGLDGVDNMPENSNTEGVQPTEEGMDRTGGLTSDAQQRLAAGGTGWGKAMPNPLEGWSEYAGPTPQVVHRNAPVAEENEGTCPVCHGSGRDPVSDRSACRNCGGTGQDPTHPTGGPNPQYGESRDPGRGLPAGGSHWATLSPNQTYSATAANYTLTWQPPAGGLSAEAMQRAAGRPSQNPYGSVQEHIRTTTPGYGERGYQGPAKGGAPFNPEDEGTYYPRANSRSPQISNPLSEDKDYAEPATGPYRMDMASCPSCGTRPTELVKDKNEDAWWHCPNCGPLANIDKRPEVNPYDPPQGFQADRSMKTGGFLSRNRKTGRLMHMLAVIHEHNELNETEAVTLARESVLHYGEGR